MPSEAQKRASRKYDAENMTVVGCKIPRIKADAFRAACRKLGTTQNAVLRETVEQTIKKAEKSPEG